MRKILIAAPKIVLIVALFAACPITARAQPPSKNDCVMWQWCVYEGAKGNPCSKECHALYPDEMNEELARESNEPPSPHGMVYEAFCTPQRGVDSNDRKSHQVKSNENACGFIHYRRRGYGCVRVVYAGPRRSAILLGLSRKRSSVRF